MPCQRIVELAEQNRCLRDRCLRFFRMLAVVQAYTHDFPGACYTRRKGQLGFIQQLQLAVSIIFS
ncbi:hypothetical protein D3C75_889280 [compost metagenome]